MAPHPASRSNARTAVGRATAALALVMASGGCSQSCKNDHPYVPYSIESAASVASAGDAAAPLVEQAIDAGAFAERPATIAPQASKQWSLDGLLLDAPAGKVFALGIVKDFDGDGHKDAFCIVRPEGKPEAAGEVVFYKGREGGSGPATSVAVAPELVSDPEKPREQCAATQRLAAVGKRTVLAELGVGCPKSGAPSRWLGVLAGDRAEKVKLAALLYDPAKEPRLTVDADGADQDGDGIDDLALRVTLEGNAEGDAKAPSEKVSAILKWLDRPAGLSREGQATDASFAMLAGNANARAKGKTASTVPAYAAMIRALYRAICPEGGVLRVVRKVGAVDMACGQSRALEDAGLAEARAYVTLGDPLRAMAAIDRAGRAPATRTAARVAEAQGWITKEWPVSTAKTTRFASAVPLLDKGKAPAYGALAFDAAGKLLIRTAAGVVRFDPEQGDEADAEGKEPWKGAVLSPDGAMRWIEAYNPCDGSQLRATFAPTGDGKTKDIALPILASRCASARGEPVHAVPIAWGPRGLEAVVGGEPLLFAPDLAKATADRLGGAADVPYAMGAPRSPNGAITVVPTPLGILVRVQGEGKHAKPAMRLLRAPDIDGATLRDCAASDDGARVACVKGNRAWVGIFDAP